MRALISKKECKERLQLIFPPSATDSVLSNDLASAAVFCFLYTDAVVPDGASTAPKGTTLIKPSMVLYMSENIAKRQDDFFRSAYVKAALGGWANLSILLKSEGMADTRWYRDNTRETLRDETLPGWLSEGALWIDLSVQTTSPRPRYALTESFAALFDPQLKDKDLESAVQQWVETNAQPTTRARRAQAQGVGRSTNAVRVNLPDGSTRNLDPGGSSRILKGVVEEWAPLKLTSPLVLLLAESRTKVHLADQGVLQAVGLDINTSELVPDALIADVSDGNVKFWFVEVVFSDGPINEGRKKKFLEWAQERGISAESCEFLTAFESRTSSIARKRLSDIATDTWMWFLDETRVQIHVTNL